MNHSNDNHLADNSSANISKILVSGDSMSPLYHDGDILSVDTDAYKNSQPNIGDIIVFKHPFTKDTLLIKQIAEIKTNGNLYVLGTNAKESTDSRSFGAIPLKSVYGKVIQKEKN